MSGAHVPCTGCAFVQKRFRVSKPAMHCLRYHMPAVERCHDYRTKPNAIAGAIDYLKRSAIK
jgi:hypothetical protein